MTKKALYTLEILIIAAIFFVASHLLNLTPSPFISFEHSLFELQNKYAEQTQTNLENFLQPLVGPGNIKAFVRLKLSNTHQMMINKSTPHQNLMKTTYQGIVLDQQNVSVVINTTSSVSKKIFEDLITNALGINTQKGDTLSIQLLPFKEIAPLTFGLSRLTLIRLAGILLITIFGLFILLLILYFREHPSVNEPLFSGKSLPIQHTQTDTLQDWIYLTKLSTNQINLLLSRISKSTLISALQTAPLKIHNLIANALPTNVWADILSLYKQTPYSFQQSQYAQEKIKQVYQNLCEEKVL